MRRSFPLSLGLILCLAGAARAADDEIKTIVDKARKVLGGDEQLAKVKAATWKGKGTVHFMGQPFIHTGQWFMQGPELSAVNLEITADCNRIKFVSVVNGENAWTKIGEGVQKLTKEQINELREEAYARWLTYLLPLKDKDFKLQALGELKSGEQTLVGVKVSHPKHRDVDLFFDKETGLLIKTETRVIVNGKEMPQETAYSEFEVQNGLKRPAKITIKRDGGSHVAAELSDFKLVEKLEEVVFAKP